MRRLQALILTAVAAVLLSTGAQATVKEATRHLLKHHDSAQAPAPSNSGETNGAECCAQLQAINFQSNLPVVIIKTGGIKPTRSKIQADICTCGSPKRGDYSGNVTFNVRGGIDSQLRNPILQYGIKMPNADSFLGMPSRKHWILYAQQLDPFGIKNWLGFNLSRGTGEYASKTEFCEVFVIDDDTDLQYPKHYKGLYLGLQKISQGTHGVDVTKTQDTTPAQQSSFILEFEHAQNYNNKSTVDGPVTFKPWNILYPKTPTSDQTEVMQRALSDFETTLYATDFTDPTNGWRKYANETAFADWFIAEELIKNAKHSYHSAAFMYKNDGKPLAMGPVWDLVQGFGTCCGYPVTGYEQNGTSGPGLSGGSGISPNGWLFDICLEPARCKVLNGYDPGDGIALWFVRLWQDPTWRADLAKRWTELRAGPWQTSVILSALNDRQAKLAQAAQRTLQEWPEALAGVDYNGVFSQISAWLTARLQWMDGAWALAAAGPAFAPFPSAFPPSATPAVTSQSTAG